MDRHSQAAQYFGSLRNYARYTRYDELMQIRLDILAKHKITLADIHGVIDEMNPIDGALQFLRRIRRSLPVIILSDTFSQFLPPILPKLEWPTILLQQHNR